MNSNRKVRVLHVAQAAGGVERYLQMLFAHSDSSKFEKILICSQDYNTSVFEEIVDSIEVVEMHRAISLKNDYKAICNIRKMIKKYNPDIIYAHSSKAGAVTRIANIGMKKICIYNPHGWAFSMRCGKVKQLIYAVIEQMLSMISDKIICISEAEKEAGLNYGICRRNKLEVICNGINLDTCREIQANNVLTRKELGIPEDAYIIGTVARISEQKSPDIFIRAAKEIKKSIPNAFFMIVGDGEQRESIEQFAEENDLKQSLLITGWVKEPYKYMNLFDNALLLSRWEGFGLVLPEYMAAGAPIIATKVDAIPDIIEDNKNGLLVEVDNYKQVAEKVVLLYNDYELRKSLVKQGLIDVNKYDIKRVALEHEQLFETMIGTL